jgi:hypothetical protein
MRKNIYAKICDSYPDLSPKLEAQIRDFYPDFYKFKMTNHFWGVLQHVNKNNININISHHHHRLNTNDNDSNDNINHEISSGGIFKI